MEADRNACDPGIARVFARRGARQGRCVLRARGPFVDDVPLLLRSRTGYANERWSARPIIDLNHDLTARYRLPIDVTTKANAMALIAAALDRDDLALAAIETVHMQFPDPPPLAKGVETDEEIKRRARELYLSGLLKTAWDPAEHPRTGEPPNPGWFAPVAGSEARVRVAAADNPWDKLKPLQIDPGEDAPDSEVPQLKLPFSGGLSETPPPATQLELPFPRLPSSPSIIEEPAKPPSRRPMQAPAQPWSPPERPPSLPFESELQPQLAPYKGGKTYGNLSIHKSEPYHRAA